jgi:RNA polymerase sigma-70 factor, ECF subfamily
VLKSNAFRRILPFGKLMVESKEKSPEVKVIGQSTSSLVTAPLLNLPPKYREILFLFLLRRAEAEGNQRSNQRSNQP